MAKKILNISKNEVIQMIKEEYAKKQTEMKLKKRLNEVNSQIKNLLKEDEMIDEVEASGIANTTSPDGLTKDAKKAGVKFEKKGTHLLEDDELELNITDEIPEDEDINLEDENLEGDLESIIAQLATAIEKEVEEKVEEKIEGTSDEVTDEMPTDEVTDEMPTDEVTDEIPEELDEQDGHTMATDKSPASPPINASTPFTETQTTVNESVKPEKKVLSEEYIRRQQLAGIRVID